MLRETFKDHVASTAFKTIDGELRVVGKFGQISQVGDKFDLWLVKPDMEQLGTGKINNLEKKMPAGWRLRKLNNERGGEAYLQTDDVAGLLSILPFIGVKKRRKVSEETKQKMINNLAKYRGLTGE